MSSSCIVVSEFGETPISGFGEEALSPHLRGNRRNGRQTRDVVGDIPAPTGTFAGGVFEATDAQQLVVAAQAVEETIGVALVDLELHGEGPEGGIGGEAWVAAVFVGCVEDFRQFTGTRNNPIDCDFEETKAAFRWLLVMVGIIRIDFAHEDFSMV